MRSELETEQLKAQTLILVSKLAQAFPAWKPGSETLSLYVEELIDLDPHKLEKAISFFIRSDPSPFAPSIGKIRCRVKPQDNAPAIATADETEARANARIGLTGGGMGAETMLDTCRRMGFWHLAWHMEHPGAGRTGIPGVVRIFAERNAECPCRECDMEFSR